jgi:hypothetical protein
MVPLVHITPACTLLECFGDEQPSRAVVNWSRSGKYNEYPAFTTRPQQDVQKNRSAITIPAVIDNRAQPIGELVRANMHRESVLALPPKDATMMEVREFIFFVLACRHFSKVADENPTLVVTAVSRWRGNGDDLRDLHRSGKWNEVCPKSW